MNGNENAKLDQILERLIGLKDRVHKLHDTVCGPPGKPDQGLCWVVKKNGERIGRLCDKVDEIREANQVQRAESRAKAKFVRKWGPWIAVAGLGAMAGGGSSELFKGIFAAVTGMEQVNSRADEQ